MRRTDIFFSPFCAVRKPFCVFVCSRSKVGLYVGGLCAEGINVYYPCLPRVLRKLLKSLHPVTQPIGGIVGSVILVHQGILGFLGNFSV